MHFGEWQASVSMKSRRVAEEETEEQGDEIAGLGVLASVPGGVMRGVAFILETFRKSSVDLSYAEP